MWDKITQAYTFFVTDIFVPLLVEINDNQMLRIALLIPAVTGFLFLIIWFFEEVAALDVWNGRKSRLSTVYTYPFRYSKYKPKKDKVIKPSDYFDESEYEKEKKIKDIEGRLDEVPDAYKKDVAKQIYRNRVRRSAKTNEIESYKSDLEDEKADNA